MWSIWLSGGWGARRSYNDTVNEFLEMAMVSTKSSTSLSPAAAKTEHSVYVPITQDIFNAQHQQLSIVKLLHWSICFPTPVPNRLRLRPWNSPSTTRAFRAVPSTAIIPNTTFYRALPRRRSTLAFLLVPKK